MNNMQNAVEPKKSDKQPKAELIEKLVEQNLAASLRKKAFAICGCFCNW